MAIIAIIPTDSELEKVLDALTAAGHQTERTAERRLPLWRLPALELHIALGGLGKAQFGVQTQYLLDSHDWKLAICGGAAGALVDAIGIGDVIVATETIEHDIRKVGRALVPRFDGDHVTLARLKDAVTVVGAFGVHFGGIASGDEDVVDVQRRAACREATSALAVAWEGAGGARACAFSGVPFLEIRSITDRADETGPKDFRVNLGAAMGNLAKVLTIVAGMAV